MLKAQGHWAKDIEHFGTGKSRVLEIEQKKELFISSDLTSFSLTFHCVKKELIATMKKIYRTHFFLNGT